MKKTEVKVPISTFKQPSLFVVDREGMQRYEEGAHRYQLLECEGYDADKKETKLLSSRQQFDFVYKDERGIDKGITSEQVLSMLLHRHTNLNKAYPCPQNEKLILCLQHALDAIQERINDREAREVMGELKI